MGVIGCIHVPRCIFACRCTHASILRSVDDDYPAPSPNCKDIRGNRHEIRRAITNTNECIVSLIKPLGSESTMAVLAFIDIFWFFSCDHGMYTRWAPTSYCIDDVITPISGRK